MTKLKGIMLYIWQLPQNLIGLLFLLFIKGEQKHTLYGVGFYSSNGFRGGISLGQYIIMGYYYEEKIKHEWGHCIQSKMLGPLYLLVIGLPSLIWCWLHGTLIPRDKVSYFWFYTEKWADKLGGVER